MEEHKGETFIDRDLSGARFNRVDLSGARMRGVAVSDMEIDSPWLCEGGNSLYVNGIDVAPYVDTELDRQFPGRELRRASDPEGLRAAWDALEGAWATTVESTIGLPDGSVHESVDGEWSFAQTLRHLVMATDTWLGKAILHEPQPYHPLGLPHAEFAEDGGDMSVFTTASPTYADILGARADRQAKVRTFLASVRSANLEESQSNPHDANYQETTLSCVHTILEEEWEHHRYAVRDLAALRISYGTVRNTPRTHE